MARPAFSLTDADGGRLVRELDELASRCPLDARSHRAYVREFVRIVHRITGRTFSPTIYRRLLRAYAPDRSPSAATLALEKQDLDRELAVRVTSIAPAPTGSALADPVDATAAEAPADWVEQIGQVIEKALGTRARGRSDAYEQYLVAQCNFLQARLTESEQHLIAARATTASLAAHNEVIQAAARRDQEELLKARDQLAGMDRRLATLTEAIDDARSFALIAIDGARGETRAWRERCSHAEAQLREQTALSETFRRLAYQRGADIPPSLQRPSTS